jgi:hypothetical protein
MESITMHKALTLTALCLAGTTSAQIPLPAFVRTFTSATSTRGYYFQTPVNITVTGLRVPNESNHPLQNVELFKMTSAPPAFPATATGGQVFYSVGQPSGTVIPCNVSFAAGEWVGVLGACGDSTTMRNSYGTANFPSNVLGNPITLIRMLTQTNIVSSGGNQPYSSEAAFEVSRVEMFVAGQSSAIDYGTGAGIGANPAPTLTTTALPIINQTGTLSWMQNYSPNQGGILALGRGRANTPVFQGTLWVNPAVLFLFYIAPLISGANAVNFPIPNDTGLLGAGPLDFQGFVLQQPNVAMTNGVEWFLGR